MPTVNWKMANLAICKRCRCQPNIHSEQPLGSALAGVCHGTNSIHRSGKDLTVRIALWLAENRRSAIGPFSAVVEWRISVSIHQQSVLRPGEYSWTVARRIVSPALILVAWGDMGKRPINEH